MREHWKRRNLVALVKEAISGTEQDFTDLVSFLLTREPPKKD